MKVLVINSGSSSIKYQLFNMDEDTVLAQGLVEKIGEPTSRHTYEAKASGSSKIVLEDPLSDHAIGLKAVVDLLTDSERGVIKEKSEVEAVGHRVVHGGETFKHPAVIDDAVLNAIRDNIPLAPLHNPANITGIEATMQIFPNAKQVAVFDTAFHHTIPAHAYQYAVPYELYEKYKVRRYGFHGTSHHFVALEAAKMMNKPLEELNLVTLHLGNGCSMAAIKNGKCIDTSMGLTPLEGLMMGTRSGDLDPAIPQFLTQQANMSIDDVNTLLNKKSGLKGICGMNDMRDIHSKAAEGDEKAKLAIDMLTYRIKKYLGSYIVALGSIDAIIFTAGVGENDEVVREKVCENMDIVGIKLDVEKSNVRQKVAREVQDPSSKVKVMIIPTNEELMIAIETIEVLKNA